MSILVCTVMLLPPLCRHWYNQTHALWLGYMHTLTRAPSSIRTLIHNARTHLHTYKYTDGRTYTHTHTPALIHTRMHTHTHKYAHSRTLSRPHMHILTHTHTHANSRSHKHKQITKTRNTSVLWLAISIMQIGRLYLWVKGSIMLVSFLSVS